MADPRRKLILVRHSLPEMVRGVRASRWPLCADGRQLAETLAGRLAELAPAGVVTSEEPKAFETGQIVARILGLCVETEPGLHEHERGIVYNLHDRARFEAQITRFFERPDQLVFGSETADQAHARFSDAIGRVLVLHPVGNVTVVSHGTVMTLFIARANGLAPYGFWKSLGLPSFAVLALPDLGLLRLIRDVAKEPDS